MKKNYDKLISGSLFFILVFQIAVVFVMNCTRTATFLDFDSAPALRHAVDMWRHKQLVFPDYVDVSSMEIDCIPFFAAPFYMMTGKMGLSFGCIHAIVMVLFALVVFDIMDRCGISRRYACIANIMIFTPYMCGQLDYFNMLFISAGQYEFRVLTVLLGIDVLMIKKFSKIRDIFAGVVFLVFLFLTTLSTGAYMLVAVLLPMFLFMAVDFLYDKKNFSFKKAMFVVVTLIGCTAILWLRTNYFGVDTGRKQFLCSYSRYGTNFINCFFGIFTLLGGISEFNNIEVFSIESMQILLKLVFWFLMFGFEIRMVHKKKLFSSSPLVRACILITCVQLFILIVADTNYGAAIFEYRYHILWVVENFICFIACLYEYNENGDTDNRADIKKYSAVILAVVLSLSNIYGFIQIYIYNSFKISTVLDISEVARENNRKNILMYGKEDYTSLAHIIRAVDIDSNAIFINDRFDSAHILDYYKGAADALAVGPENLLVTTEEAYKTIPEYYRSVYKYVGEKNENVFYVTENSRWDFQSGFPKYLDESADYIESELYSESEDKDGNITAETEFTAPADSHLYNYNITVEFSDYSSGHASVTLKGANFELNDTNEDGDLSIENIELLEHEDLKLTLNYASDMKINRILYTRKNK